MSRKSLKVQVEIPGWNSIDTGSLLRELKEKVLIQLNENNVCINESIVSNACKNALSLARSKKKNKSKFLSVYIAQSLIDNSSFSSPSSVSSTDIDETRINVEEDISEVSSVVPDSLEDDSRLSFNYTEEKGLVIRLSYNFLKEIFHQFLNRSSKPINISNIIIAISEHCFHSDAKHYIDIPKMRRHLYSQLSCFIREAKKKARGKHTTVTKALRDMKTFCLHTNAVEPVKKSDQLLYQNFDTYESTNSSGRLLLIRHEDIVCIQPGNECLYVHISESFSRRIFEMFDVYNVLDINDLLDILRIYCEKRNIVTNFEKIEDLIKTTMLDRRINGVETHFLTFTILLDDSHRASLTQDNFNLDDLLGPVYSTRTIKRKNQVVPFDSEESDLDEVVNDDDELWKLDRTSVVKQKKKQSPVSIEKEELKRKFLHIKDEYHVTDSAIKAMHKFFQEAKESFYSMSELEQVRNKSNRNIPLKFTKDSAYVPFDFALRVAIFVAIKFRPDILRLNELSFRLNMDGTLMGNKHVVAISVNCVDGGPCCQTAKKLVPVGIFEIQKESNELLRKTLPKEFLDSIQSVKYLNVTQKKTVAVKIRLGGDFQNAVYVFGLAGVHCNYPCVFCTQNKSFLHVTEKNTECEEEVWVGTGKNRKKKKQKVIINPTSSYDPTRGARSLEEKRYCLAQKAKNKTNNELGYQSEPLFGDLFECSDYVIDTLHMKLRIFDILLKDILSEASRTGEYEPAHTRKLEERVDTLNNHATNTIGKRFFFKIETENNVKTIVPCGRFSGHLQDIFFNDSFPYEKIMADEVVSRNTKCLVKKFKFIIELIKTEKSKRTALLADVAKSFVNDFRKSGLRTGCTPYMHLIGSHLAEQDEHENLTAYDMQGVEKSNDLLSRLYFSSSNRAKTPLRTMMQSLYRRLEMNFTDENERGIMARYALTGSFDEDDSDKDKQSMDTILNHSVDLKNSDTCSTCDSESEESMIDLDEDINDEAPSYVTQSYSRMNVTENRWKSFKQT